MGGKSSIYSDEVTKFITCEIAECTVEMCEDAIEEAVDIMNKKHVDHVEYGSKITKYYPGRARDIIDSYSHYKCISLMELYDIIPIDLRTETIHRKIIECGNINRDFMNIIIDKLNYIDMNLIKFMIDRLRCYLDTCVEVMNKMTMVDADKYKEAKEIMERYKISEIKFIKYIANRACLNVYDLI